MVIKFKKEKIYSQIFASIFFTTIVILAMFIISSDTNSLLFTSNSQAGLTENQSVQYILTFLVSHKYNFIWWIAVVIFFTILGFLCGRFIDNRRAKYIKINSDIVYNLK